MKRAISQHQSKAAIGCSNKQQIDQTSQLLLLPNELLKRILFFAVLTLEDVVAVRSCCRSLRDLLQEHVKLNITDAFPRTTPIPPFEHIFARVCYGINLDCLESTYLTWTLSKTSWGSCVSSWLQKGCISSLHLGYSKAVPPTLDIITLPQDLHTLSVVQCIPSSSLFRSALSKEFFQQLRYIRRFSLRNVILNYKARSLETLLAPLAKAHYIAFNNVLYNDWDAPNAPIMLDAVLPALRSVHTICIANCNLKDLTVLSGVHTLKLRFRRNLPLLSPNMQLQQLSLTRVSLSEQQLEGLNFIPYLRFNTCSLWSMNLSSLARGRTTRIAVINEALKHNLLNSLCCGSIQRLTIKNCNGLSINDNLGKFRRVTVDHSPIASIKHLKGVQQLTLKNTNIDPYKGDGFSFSTLGSVLKLKLKNTTCFLSKGRYLNLESLSVQHSLRLINVQGVRSLPARFKQLPYLELHAVPSVTKEEQGCWSHGELLTAYRKVYSKSRCEVSL